MKYMYIKNKPKNSIIIWRIILSMKLRYSWFWRLTPQALWVAGGDRMVQAMQSDTDAGDRAEKVKKWKTFIHQYV